jgi:hypothetical protein
MSRIDNDRPYAARDVISDLDQVASEQVGPRLMPAPGLVNYFDPAPSRYDASVPGGSFFRVRIIAAPGLDEIGCFLSWQPCD